MDDDIPYLLLTPGPLTTSKGVRHAMLRDWCTWDDDYNRIVTDIRNKLVALSSPEPGFTCVLMQGSGSFAVEATLGSVIPPNGKILLVNNGAYGQRMVAMAARLGIAHVEIALPETEPANPVVVEKYLANDRDITHVAIVHCETTTGMLNPVEPIGKVVRGFDKTFIVDAMSSFGGIPLTMQSTHADYLISSANKCIQGVPGFGFVVADRVKFQATRGWARSLCLDLFDQWNEMETKGGKWRYTSPTHVVRAFAQALLELELEGGVAARNRRYSANQQRLSVAMRGHGFQPLLPAELQSPIITSFYFPKDPAFTFIKFYEALKKRRFVIYPGKISQAETFRIGNIGHVFPADIDRLIGCVGEAVAELGLNLK